MRIILIVMVLCSLVHPFKLSSSCVSVQYTAKSELIEQYHKDYSSSIQRWKNRKSNLNLEKMRAAKSRLSEIKRLKKSGKITIFCRGRRFIEQRTFSITAHSAKGEDRIGIHTFVGLTDSLSFYVDVVPKKIVVIDQISKKKLTFRVR